MQFKKGDRVRSNDGRVEGTVGNVDSPDSIWLRDTIGWIGTHGQMPLFQSDGFRLVYRGRIQQFMMFMRRLLSPRTSYNWQIKSTN